MPKVLAPIVFAEQATPSTPTAGLTTVFANLTGDASQVNDAGAVTNLAAAGGGGVSESYVIAMAAAL